MAETKGKKKSPSKAKPSPSPTTKDKTDKPPAWVPLQREYAEERERSRVPFQRTKLHPLLSTEVLAKVAARKAALLGEAAGDAKGNEDEKGEPVTDSPTNVSARDDPLAALGLDKAGSGLHLAGGLGNDPLSAGLVTPSRALPPSRDKGGEIKMVKPADFEYWKDKTARILSTYATNTRMPVSANFLEDDQEEENKTVGEDGKAVTFEAKNRLEQLEAEKGAHEKSHLMMSQKEYIAYIEAQHDRLKKAWEGGDRVLSLKIAIQCGKKLNDTSVPQLYPSMYVLLTAVLDTFGDLVFERIKSMGAVEQAPAPGQPAQKTHLPYDFQPSDVTVQAKETCRNWFYKTACIRELMPRMYCELALIKSYRFLGEEPFEQMLQRIAKTIRGLGDPLAAQYARCFLATKCVDLWGSFSDPRLPKPDKSWFMPDSYQEALLLGFNDFLFVFKSYKQTAFSSVAAVRDKRIALGLYIDLYGPAVQWTLQCLGYKADSNLFFALLKQYRECCKNAMVLYQLLDNFNPEFISRHALSMTSLIKEAEPNERTPKSRLYLALGKALVQVAPPREQRLPILNNIWKAVTKIQDPKNYMEIAQVFVQYILVHFNPQKVDIFLKDVVKHMLPDRVYLGLQKELLTIALKIVQLSGDRLLACLSMDNFLPVLDLLDKRHKAEASKTLLQAFKALGQVTADPVIVHTLFEVAKSLHDAVDSLSFDDDRRQIADLLIYFIRGIDYGRDLEKQLATLVECRQAFSGLDSVIRECVLRVGLVAMQAHALVKGKHNKKTSAFVKACLAYCHITIPALDDSFERLYLLMELGQIGLVNGMISQSEGFLKAAIALIEKVPATYTDSSNRVCSNQERLTNYLLNLSSFLLLFPGHPTQGPFYLVKGLLNAVANYEPWKQPSQAKARVYLGILQLFCSYAQRNFPVHIKGVDSNDSLYGGDPKYLQALYSFVDILVTGVLQQLEHIGAQKDLVAQQRQGELALDFVNVLLSFMQMNAQSATAVVKLYTLAAKSSAVEQSYLESTLGHLQSKPGTWYQDIFNMINKQLAASPAAGAAPGVANDVASRLRTGSSLITIASSRERRAERGQPLDSRESERDQPQEGRASLSAINLRKGAINLWVRMRVWARSTSGRWFGWLSQRSPQCIPITPACT
eukprot:g67639.t1